MAKIKSNRIIALICVLALIAGSLVFFAINSSERLNFTRSEFAADYSAIMKKYGANPKADLDKDEFGLARLIVTDYNGEDYGAVASAVSGKTAVLQYENADAARSAAEKFKDDGISAEPDSYARLEALEAGTVCEWASDMVGTTDYINECRMAQSDVVVAQIDTGVMTEHPAIEGRFVSKGYDMTSDGCENAEYDKKLRATLYWHATAVASVITNNTTQSVKILPYKVVPFGTDICYSSSIIASIRDAIDRDVDVINMSLNTYGDGDSFKVLIKEAYAKGICVCCSAGNDSTEIKNRYPSSVEQSIAVSSVNSDKEFSSFSNYGDLVDFCAPGGSVRVAAINSEGNATYYKASGTSLSSPYAAACCAMLKTVNKDLSVEAITGLLADFALDLGDQGFDKYYGNGLLQIGNIVESGSCGENVQYTFKIPQGTVEISGSGSVQDYPKEQDRPWNDFAGGILNVTVEDTVSGIGSRAFQSMSSASFQLPDNLLKVGAYAFSGCSNLKSITFDKDVVSIGTGAFSNCGGLTVSGWRNTAAESAASASDADFVALGCVHNYVCEIIEPDPENGIEGELKYTCAVCSDTYSEPYVSPEVIGSGQCGDGVTWRCHSTGQLFISGNGAMYDYSTAEVPWKDISDKINSVFIENGVTYVSPFAFAKCGNITAFSAEDCAFSSVEGVLYSADGAELVCYPGGKNNTTYTIPENVTAVSPAAFLSAGRLQSVDAAGDNFVITDEGLLMSLDETKIIMALPQFSQRRLVLKTDAEVGDYAFILSDSLSELVLTSDISLGKYSVGYNYDNGFVLSGVTVYGVENSAAQEYCSDVINFVAVNSGTCGSDIKWRFDLDSNTLTLTGSGSMSDYSSEEEIPWAIFADRLESAEIDENITSLSSFAFYDCKGLKTMKLPAQLTYVTDETVFAGCNGVTNIDFLEGSGSIPNIPINSKSALTRICAENLSSVRFELGIKSIGSAAFYGCGKISTVVFPYTVQKIGQQAFRNCTSIKNITLGSGTKSIENYAFYNCTSLTKVYIYATQTVFGNQVFYGVPDGLVLSAYYDTTAMDYCEANGYTFSPLGCLHRIFRDEGDAPTCTEGSVVSRYCARCGKYIGEVSLPAAGHKYEETVITKPSCTESGMSVYKCSACGDEYTSEKEPLGHDFETVSYNEPTCCESGSAVYRCKRCNEEKQEIIPALGTVHYVKGTVTDPAGNALSDINVYCDGVLSAVTNDSGVFMFDGVKCGSHKLTFEGDGCVTAQSELTVSGGNFTSENNIEMLVGDVNGDGWVNGRDYVLTDRAGGSWGEGKLASLPNSNEQPPFNVNYGSQSEIGLYDFKVYPDETSDYRMQFEANVREFNEYTVVESGFIYGKNMDEDMLTLENVGKANSDGYVVKKSVNSDTSGKKVLTYGSSSGGTVSARYYIVYTNGVFTRTYLSEVQSYTYE